MTLGEYDLMLTGDSEHIEETVRELCFLVRTRCARPNFYLLGTADEFRLPTVWDAYAYTYIRIALTYGIPASNGSAFYGSMLNRPAWKRQPALHVLLAQAWT